MGGEHLLGDLRVSCWETTNEEGVRLSDHPTVAIDILNLPALELDAT